MDSVTNAVMGVSSLDARLALLNAYIFHHAGDSRVLDFLQYQVLLPPWLTRHGVMMILSAALLLLLFGLGARRRDPVPHGLANLLETLVVFVRNQIAIPSLGEEDGRRMTPLFCSFFFFILMMNLIGLIPGFYTPTSNISVTAALAAVTFGFMVFGAMWRHGVAGFFRGFVPPGVPWAVLWLVVLLEILGVFVRSVALTIRLFANMLAGHIVIGCLVGLVVVFGVVALPAILMAVLIYVIEIGVAFLQAYIFTLLSAAFIGQRYHPEH